MKQKIVEISFLHVFAILLVVIGHSFFQTESLIVDWIYQFHVPLFFFVSGYLFHISVQGKPLQSRIFLRRKAVRLLLPYFVLSTLLFVPKVLFSQFMVRPIQASWSEYVLMLVYPYRNVNGSYWFLPTIFLTFVFAVTVLSLSQRRPYLSAKLMSCLLLSLLFLTNILLPTSRDIILNINGAIYYAFYFSLGYYVCHYRLIELIDKRKTSIILLLSTLSISFIGLHANEGPIIKLLLALNGILMSVSIALLYKRNKHCFLNYLSPASFTIYLYHGIFQALSIQILMHFTHFNHYIYTFLAIITGIYGPFFVYKLLYGCRNSRLGRFVALVSGLN